MTPPSHISKVESHIPQTKKTGDANLWVSRKLEKGRNNRSISTISQDIHREGLVREGQMLLDNQSTVNVFCYLWFLKNIRKASCFVDIHCNAGTTSADQIGDLPGFGPVWFNKHGVANMLSMAKVERMGNGTRMTHDVWKDSKFVAHKEGGATRIFQQSDRGMCFLGADEKGTAVVTAAADKKSKYPNRNCSQGSSARKLQNITGRPSPQDHLQIAKQKDAQ